MRRRTKRALANGTETLYQYDNAGQMTNILHRRSDQTTISCYAYGYDDAGRRTWVLRANGRGDVFRYDATDQLTNVLYEALNPHSSPSGWTNEARYTFDPAGNRTSVTLTNSGTVNYTANALNQYTAVGNVTPGYDANGNLTWDGRWAYAYDRENRLVQAANDQMTVTYRYDAFNRLVERSVGSAVVRYYYDDRWRLVAEYDGAGNLLAKYVYGPEIDEPVRMTRYGSEYYYHAAALGTVTEITDALGNLVERYSYDVYGEPTIFDSQSSILSTSAVGNRLLFQGRDLDPDTGLYNFRNRYYTPRWGRFVQVDPIRAAAGLNLYSFIDNTSVNWFDPLELKGSKEIEKHKQSKEKTDDKKGKKCCEKPNPHKDLLNEAVGQLGDAMADADDATAKALGRLIQLLQLAAAAKSDCDGADDTVKDCQEFANTLDFTDCMLCCKGLTENFPAIGGLWPFGCPSVCKHFN